MASVDSVYKDLQSLASHRDRTIWRRIFDKMWPSDPTNRLVNITTSTITITALLHEGKVLTMNRAAGIVASLPKATGNGHQYTFIVGTTATGAHKIAANGTDTLVGGITLWSDNAADAVTHFKAGGTDDYISMNGTTKGGYQGAKVILTDIASGLWHIEAISKATGSEETPFAAT